MIIKTFLISDLILI